MPYIHVHVTKGGKYTMKSLESEPEETCMLLFEHVHVQVIGHGSLGSHEHRD